MNVKDAINKISGISSLALGGIIISGYLLEWPSLLGFPNAFLLYGLMPMGLIWFGTRKNGCGSCNQSLSIHDRKNTEKNSKIKK